MNHALSDEMRYRLLEYLELNPNASQRDLARQLGISLGKANYCLRALIEKGWLKARNFRSSNNKLAYTYHLTPRGVEERVNAMYAFMKRKMEEYDALSKEIEQLNRDIAKVGSPSPDSAAS